MTTIQMRRSRLHAHKSLMYKTRSYGDVEYKYEKKTKGSEERQIAVRLRYC